MNCFNLSKPAEKKEYKRLLQYSNIPAFINKVFDYTNGDTKGIKSKEDFNKVLKSALDTVIKSPALKDTTSKLPLSRFTFEQREELVDNIIFLTAFDGDSQSLKPLKNINLSLENVKGSLLSAKQLANPVYHSNYDEALKPENLEVLIDMATAKLNSMGVQVDLEEDPDSKNDGMKEFEDSFLIENKTRARAFVKLLVGSLPKKELGTTLGITKFVPYDKTFNDLEELLSDLYIEPGKDAYEVFKDKINSATAYRPEYIQLLKFLDKTNDQHKIQFIRAFSTLSINFSSTSIDVTKDSMGVETSYMSSDSVTAESQILLIWEGAFKEYFIKEGKEPEANNIPTIKAAEDRYKNKIKKELRKRIKKGETKITQEDFNDTVGILGFLGIGIKENALKLYLSDNSDGNDLKSLNNLYTNVIDKVFYGTSVSTNALSHLAKNEVKHEDGYVKSPITDESEIKALASYQAKFDETIITNGFPGPDGKIYQSKSQYDYASKVIEDIKNSNNYLEKIEGSDFNTNSKFIEQLKDPKVKKNFKLEHFNSRRSKGQDGGKTMKDLSPVDEYADRIDRVLTKGQLSYLTLADKNRLYFISGLTVFKEDADNKIKDKDLVSSSNVSEEMVDTVLGYFADELISSRRYFLINKITTKGQKKRILTGIEANMKTSSVLPGLSFGSKEGDDNGLYHTDGTPFKMSTSYIEEVGDPKNPEIVINPGFFSNSNLRDYIKNVLEERILASSQNMLDTLFTFDEKGILDETAISTDLFKTFINPKIADNKKPTRNEVLEGINVMATNFVYKSVVGNVEWSKIFTGDPRKYKSLEDYMKRTPATSATGDHLYINEKIGSKKHFKLAIASDVDEHNAEELTITANIDNIAQWLGVDKNDEELNNVLSVYGKNNRTDAQGWMTMDRFKDILKGLGEWNQEMDPGFNRLKNGTETEEDIKLFSTKMTSMQPKKGMYYSLVVDEWGNANPIYLKYSTAVLFPGMIKTSPKLAKIAKEMEAQGIDELVVEDGVKVGKIASTDINNDEIIFNPVTLENKYWKLQQDLPFKDKETNVGSQLQKNIIGDIDLFADFGPYGTGEDVLRDIHSTISELSNRGFDKVLNKLGLEKEEVEYDEETGRWEIDSRANLNKLYDSLIEEYTNDGETGDVIQMLKERQPLDFIYTHGNTIMSKVTSIFTKNAIQLEQPGGSAIQMSNFGFDLGDDRGVAKTISQLPDHIKNEITWLQKENELTAPTVKTNPKTGELEFSRAQVALPYSALEKLFGEEWEELKNLPIDELRDRIDPKALQGIGYRIPNQKLASNDPIEIVAILPPTAGNTIVAYAAVTTKTGSDFDIDKMYYTMRPIKKSKKNGKTYIEAVKYLDKNSTVEERAESLVRNTSELARVMSMLYDTESVKNIINDMNDWYALRETAYYKKGLKLQEEEDKINNIFSQIKELKAKLKKASKKEKESIIIDIADLQFTLSRITKEEDMVMEVINKYRKDLVTSVSEKIKGLSIDEQNTKKALQSRRIDLYDAILTHPSSYLRLMSTVDSDWLKDHINMTLPKSELKDLEFYTGEFHMNARRENISSKSGVGQVANHQVDHAISQWAEIYLNQENRLGMGNTTKEGMVDLSGKTVTEFEIIAAYDKDGNKIESKDLSSSKPVKYKIEKVIKNKVVITEVTSAYMNAFVDAAKDNYIGRANFNRLTNNTAFLLIRAGISPQFVNAFLSQPIIKEYVKETMINEGQATPISSKKPIDKVLDKFGEGAVPSEASKLSDFNTLDMMNTILKYQNSKEDVESLDMSERLDQVEILELFMHIVETSKHLRDSIISTKSDTGIGKSLFDAYIITTTRDNVRNVNLIGNYNKKFEKDEMKTMAGTFYKNGPAAANEIVGKQTLLGTSGMQKYLHNTYRQLWGELPSDSRKLRKLYNMGVGALISYISDFSMTQEESAAFNSGVNSIAKRIVKLQNNDKYKDNFLASMLVTDISYNGDISYVGINNFKPRNASVNKQISNAWQELYEDPATKQLATDLAKYAFHSSGTMDTGSTLYRLMPYRIAQQLGLNTETYNKIRNVLNIHDISQSLMNQVLINSWYDTELVPKIPNKNALQIGKSPVGIIFRVNDVSSPGLKVGTTENNQPVFKPFLRRTLSNKLATDRIIYEDALFKYVGNIKDSETGRESGVYKRVPRFGTKQGIFKLFEFTFKDPNRNSVVKYNKLKPFISTAVNTELAKIQGSLIDPQPVYMKSQRNVIKEYGASIKEDKENTTNGIEEVADGIKIINNSLTSSEELEIFQMIKPLLESQGSRSNKGKNAPIMIGMGLRWDYKSNNPGKSPIEIKETIVNTQGQRNKYAYYDVSIDGEPLGKIPTRLKELMTKATGIDSSNYDGAIINIYPKGGFISAHNDVDESITAINYPVIVANIGGAGSLSIEGAESQKDRRDYSNKEYVNKPLSSGSSYIFGEDGKNRSVFHRTLPSSGKGNLPQLNIKGQIIPANSYRISVTLRRVKDLEQGMPDSPAKSQLIQQTTKDKLPYYEGMITSLEDNQVFVFGSNPEGRHGKGAAKTAMNFGAIYGQGEGMQGQSYALPTKDLRVKENNGLRSISSEQITNSISTLYNIAEENNEKEFLVSDYSGKNLNGYTGKEMAEMFVNAGKIPDNIIFNKNFLPMINEEIKKKCQGNGSGPKAKDGAQFGFTPGSRWKIIKDFKGKSHDQGGIDINISKNGIKMSGKNGNFEAKKGCIINSKSLK